MQCTQQLACEVIACCQKAPHLYSGGSAQALALQRLLQGRADSQVLKLHFTFCKEVGRCCCCPGSDPRQTVDDSALHVASAAGRHG